MEAVGILWMGSCDDVWNENVAKAGTCGSVISHARTH